MNIRLFKPLFCRVRLSRLLCGVVAALGSIVPAKAQLPGRLDPAFNPSLRTEGSIDAIVRQADNKLIVAGKFYRVGSSIIHNVARLGPDGSVDPSFNPPAALSEVFGVGSGPDGKVAIIEAGDKNYAYRLLRLNTDGSVDSGFSTAAIDAFYGDGMSGPFTVVIQPDGRVLVAATFLINSQGIHTVKRFNSDGSPDPTFQFDPNLNASEINAVIVLPNGQMLVGGEAYGFAGGPFTRSIFRLNSNGSADESYTPATEGRNVRDMAFQADGKLLYLTDLPDTAAPAFSSDVLYGGIPRRLNADGSSDTTFIPQFSEGESFRSLALDADGKVLVGGYTASYYITPPGSSITQSVVRSGVVRLNADGSIDSTFQVSDPLVGDPDAAVGTVIGVDSLPGGQILVAGTFDQIGGLSRIRLGRLNHDGSVDANYANDLTEVGDAYSVAVQQSGLPIVLSSAILVDGAPGSHLSSFNADGSVHTAFNLISPGTELYPPYYQMPTFYEATADNPVNSAISLQADGKILITGTFRVATPPYSFGSLARLNVDGSLDLVFKIGGPQYAAQPQPDGRIVTGGNLGFEEGQPYPVERLTSFGTFDPSFYQTQDPGSQDYVLSSTFSALALQPDGKIIAAGYLNPVGGHPSPGVIRFNSDGSVDSTFQAPAQLEAADGVSPAVLAIVLQPDGRVLVGGRFSTLGGANHSNVARLNEDGSLDATFDASGLGADGVVHSIALGADGKILLGGDFSTVRGTPLAGLARLLADGSVDPQWTIGAGAEGGGVNSVALSPDGSIYVAGAFTTFAGQTRDGVAHLFDAVPSITSAQTAQAQAGEAFNYQITASGNPTAYAASGLPDGLSVDPQSGVISGTPTVSGVFTVALSAANVGGSATSILQLTVAPGIPAITVTVKKSEARYGGGAGKLVVTRSGVAIDLSQKLKVACKFSGTAVNGVDYAALASKIKFLPGKDQVQVNIVPSKAPSGVEVAKLVLLPGDGYTIGDAKKAKVSIVQ